MPKRRSAFYDSDSDSESEEQVVVTAKAQQKPKKRVCIQALGDNVPPAPDPKPAVLSKWQQLEQLEANAIEYCKNDPLIATASAQQVVFGRSRRSDGKDTDKSKQMQCDIVFMGEGPGINEDRDGIPFCGASGEKLNELMQNYGLDKRDYYVMNVLKLRCIDENRRDRWPDEHELQRQAWITIEQLRILQPQVIVAIGRLALEFVRTNFSVKNTIKAGEHGAGDNMERITGQAETICNSVLNCTLFPLLHPAAAMRKGWATYNKRFYPEAFARIRDSLKGRSKTLKSFWSSTPKTGPPQKPK